MLGISNTRGHRNTELFFRHHRPWYCGTCKCLHRHHGLWSRLLLNFDLVLLGEILTAHHTAPPHRYNNGLCFSIPKSSDFSPLHRMIADLHLVFLHLKRLDAERDGDQFWVRHFSKLMESDIQRAIDNLALQGLPHQLWEDYLHAQWRLESMTLSVTEYAGPTEALCRTIVRVAGALAQTPLEATVLDQLGRAFGRWLYLADAFKDIEDDLRRKRFNAFTHSTQHITDRHKALQYVQKAQDELASVIRAMHLPDQVVQYFLKRLDFTSQYRSTATSACNYHIAPAPAGLHASRRMQALSIAASIALLLTASWQLHAAYATWIVQESTTTVHSATSWLTLLPWMLVLWVSANLYAAWKYRTMARRLWAEWKAGIDSLIKPKTDDKKDKSQKEALNELLRALALITLAILALLGLFTLFIILSCLCDSINASNSNSSAGRGTTDPDDPESCSCLPLFECTLLVCGGACINNDGC